jgi:hypothetical protein
MLKIRLFTIFTILFKISFGGDYYDDTFLRMDNYIYQKNINTVTLNLTDAPLTSPIISLGDEKTLTLSFDDLSGELRSFSYTFIHCDANWKQSDLMYSEYIDGMPEDLFFDYDYSRNTRQRFVHHAVEFPNQNMNIYISGNYIIYVFENGDRNKPVLTYRFMVSEDMTFINGKVMPGGGGEERFYNQLINFNLKSPQYDITNPYDDMKVFILQNMRWDNAKGPIKPAFVKGNEIEFGIGVETLFDAGNEFRFFNFRDLTFKAENVARNFIDSLNNNHVYLVPDRKRAYQVYLEYRDINGKRLITHDNRGVDARLDADYAYVHFELKSPEPINGNIYIVGEISHWMTNHTNLMKYNAEKSVYEATLYLKQGYYNYLYAIEDKNTGFTSKPIEGGHFATENDYTILVYHKGMRDRYDRLIGIKNFNSRRDL